MQFLRQRKTLLEKMREQPPSELIVLWLKYALTNILQCTQTGHWCSWSDASRIAVCS